jgi:signal transduction histidine kinase
MSRVVSQLLDAAELETLVIEPNERADLHATCAEVAQFMAPLALPHGKNIALSGAEGPVWIKGNAEMLRRAIRNLVENALNYAPQGTDVEIVVDGRGSVTVLDMGDGIPFADHQQIFKRFWRRDSRRPGGAGLGLSIVGSIVTAHGGTVTVRNRPTGGAEFSMRFILATDVPTERHRQIEQTPAKGLNTRSDPPLPSALGNIPATGTKGA